MGNGEVTAEETYVVDLEGHLVVKQVLSAEDHAGDSRG